MKMNEEISFCVCHYQYDLIDELRVIMSGSEQRWDEDPRARASSALLV
jgi:hypothetical protein